MNREGKGERGGGWLGRCIKGINGCNQALNQTKE